LIYEKEILMRKWSGVREPKVVSKREGVYVGLTSTGKRIFTYSKSKEEAFTSLMVSTNPNETLLSVSLEVE
jgi:hypothetical protein